MSNDDLRLTQGGQHLDVGWQFTGDELRVGSDLASFNLGLLTQKLHALTHTPTPAA